MGKNRVINNKYNIIFFSIVVIIVTLCAILLVEFNRKDQDNILDTQNPVLITLWYYRLGEAKIAMESLIDEFNDTIGKEQGIVVEAQTLGNITEFSKYLISAANHDIGSEEMPDIFLAYPGLANEIDKLYGLVDLEQYFSAKELAEYDEVFLESCRIGENRELKCLPFAESTECLWLNRTSWDIYAAETGVDANKLVTWDGILEIAENYYNWTDSKTPELNDGKTFLSMQSLSGFMSVLHAKTDEKLIIYDGEKYIFNYNREIAREAWNYYYVPYVKGYYSSCARYGMNGIKTGEVLASLYSTAASSLFPEEVILSYDKTYPITLQVFPYPYLQGEEKYSTLRGSNFSVVESDNVHEYAASVFLNWCNEPDKNIKYTSSSGYLPVKKESLSNKKVLKESIKSIKKSYADNSIMAYDVAMIMKNDYKWIAETPVKGYCDIYTLFENSLFEIAENDKSSIENGNDISQYLSEEHFNKWYEEFIKDGQKILDDEN